MVWELGMEIGALIVFSGCKGPMQGVGKRQHSGVGGVVAVTSSDSGGISLGYVVEVDREIIYPLGVLLAE
jgi:hypothetical protein